MASPQSEQQTATFLNSVLSQRGPSALPYAEELKWLIRQHLVALISSYPSLEPKTATFTHNNGRTVNLLQVDGTVPMTYQGVTYNIPVVFWLIDSYPRSAPCVYVNPTRDMVIKRPHPCVDPSGIVSIPYLQDWVFPSSNLLDLTRQLSDYFGRDPPLYSSQRRPNPPPNPNPNPNPSHHLSPTLSNSSYSSSGSYARPVIPPTRTYPPSPYGSGASFSRVQTDDPTEVYKRNAINKLVEMVHGDMAGLRKMREAEMDGLFNAQVALRQRSEQLGKGLKEMLDEKEGLEQQLQMVLMNSDVLEGWLRENEGKTKDGGVDVDDAFQCVDALSKQMLECTASDLAIEDVVYSLDKAVQDGAIPFDQYLRTVRLLSREQFFHRATAAKVRAVQMQSQVANMAARLSHYVAS
ncbi:putative ubiquitin-conjugating enzyme/RWD, steadiness box (SB) domain-containing protein [Rosa chinensis]|uniref:Putative ubiquitin-conjugating enzyme/RWD, steadiness box (SB) domain-containing protein n=1 Tax=Rosa chinensis TaxID=74649 RepID=A0A2P6QV45_ROSCH|nr:protein ELC-like [Rosa chinensis]PRQ38058.1 putative ubiquitin-conjugating enzyme/RWD, steadiness box (SB) domain-containing protein [Rosa chinensis]